MTIEDLEQKALESANKAFGLVEDMTLDMDKEFHNYHQEAFKEGYKVCQKEYEEKLRWIPINEQPPEITGWDKAIYIVKTKKEHLIAGYTDGWFHHVGGLCLKKGAVTHYRSFL